MNVRQSEFKDASGQYVWSQCGSSHLIGRRVQVSKGFKSVGEDWMTGGFRSTSGKTEGFEEGDPDVAIMKCRALKVHYHRFTLHSRSLNSVAMSEPSGNLRRIVLHQLREDA
jgi:hypothetical protein